MTAIAVAYVLAAWLFMLAVAQPEEQRTRHLIGGAPPSRSFAEAIGRRMRRRGRGRPSGDTDDVLLGRKVLLALAGLALAPVLATAGAVGILAAVVVPVAAARVPDVARGRTQARRRAAIGTAVPELLDLVAVTVSAGLSPWSALDRVPDVISGPLRDEMARARREVALGSGWRAAMTGVAERTGVREIRRLAIELDRAERLGSPVSRRLRGLARDVRGERRAAREERARRAPVQMLFPLVFLILPAFLLLTVGPVVLSTIRSL